MKLFKRKEKPMPKKEQEFVFHEPSAFLDEIKNAPKITDPDQLEQLKTSREKLAKRMGMTPEEFEDMFPI